jgi:serine protease inhibitor
MRRFVLSLMAVGTAGLMTGCTDGIGPGPDPEPITELPRDLSITEGELIQADNTFAFKLFQEINEQEGDKNIFISPLSVAMALGMTYNGAAGTTQQAMQEVLELQGMNLQEVNESYRSLIDLLQDLDPSVEFVLANSIWYRNTMTFAQEFLDLNRDYFDAEVEAIDFSAPSASETINGWVDEETNGRILEIVPETIPTYIVMYLINAIYFKADWTYQFDKSRTSDAPFRLIDGSEVTVDMMEHGGEIPVRYLWNEDLMAVELSYGGDAYVMTILLPYELGNINDVLAGLTQENWSAWLGDLYKGEVYVRLPRFTLEYELTMNDVLTALGMGVAFSPGAADFTKMYAPGGLYIDEVKHKTFVKVDEEGTEAAAATSVGIGLTSAPPMFVVDRPFVFVLREKLSGTILFMGKVVDPTG